MPHVGAPRALRRTRRLIRARRRRVALLVRPQHVQRRRAVLELRARREQHRALPRRHLDVLRGENIPHAPPKRERVVAQHAAKHSPE